jgi:hypothetical protein
MANMSLVSVFDEIFVHSCAKYSDMARREHSMQAQNETSRGKARRDETRRDEPVRRTRLVLPRSNPFFVFWIWTRLAGPLHSTFPAAFQVFTRRFTRHVVCSHSVCRTEDHRTRANGLTRQSTIRSCALRSRPSPSLLLSFVSSSFAGRVFHPGVASSALAKL